MRRVFRGLMSVTATVAVAAPGVAVAAPNAHRAELQRQLDNVVAVSAVGALAEVRDERGVWRGGSGVAV
jgi:D-alanyl-D-alanine carboxypeptidase